MTNASLSLTLLLLCATAIHSKASNRPTPDKVNLSAPLLDNLQWQHTDVQKKDAGKVIMPALKLTLPPAPKLPRVPIVTDIPERSREEKHGKRNGGGGNIFVLLAVVLGVAAVSRVGMSGCKKIRIHKNRVWKSFYKYEPECGRKFSSQVCPEDETRFMNTCDSGGCENTCVVRTSKTYCPKVRSFKS
ncbi:hypothetical protein BSKO_00762 [Bryopsis sp. KO-2023]|nr:hypothetical protein BSKO_00762 [Bryopsis sp. KO-2023]